jgi:hypothetical protein
VIKNNEKFGIDCNLPHGGNPGENYWSKGLDVAKNEFEDNDDGRISSKCKLVEVDEGDGGEEYDEDKEEESSSATDVSLKDGTTQKEESAKKEQEEREKANQQKEYMEGQLELILQGFDKSRREATQALASLENENKIWHWFWGPDMGNLNSLKKSKEALEEEIAKLDGLIAEAGDNPVVLQLREKEQTLRDDKDFIGLRLIEEENRFSMYFFLGEIFSKLRS